MKLIYRPEVDGLRCIAVMLVILHHLQLPGFSGGFVGVDVFFVISGYLITSIILAELKKEQFTFGRFYKRRVIRLAPAYFTVLLVTCIFAYVLMLPAELENFSVSALYSTFFAANLYMWDMVGGYFGTGAETTPLLHLWSLAVEEQFYVIWPVTLLLLYRFMRGYLLVVVVLALLVALGISEYGAINYRAAAYYLMPTRAFELLIGAVLACVPLALFDRVPLAFRLLLGSLGLALILYGNVFFTSDTWFPGLNALYPCVGAFLLIAFVRAGDPVLGRLLSSRLAVGIGKVSYPAYLWHWPIIVFLNLQLIDITPLVSIAVIFATLLLATLTYHYVEKPARKFRDMQWHKVVFGGFLLPAALFSTAAIAVMQNDGMPNRFDIEILKKSQAINTFAHVVRGECHTSDIQKLPAASSDCILGATKDKVDFLLVGDSHANHFTGMFDVLSTNAGVRGYDITQDSSPFMIGVDRHYKDRGILLLDRKFRTRNKWLADKISSERYGFVVLGGNFNSYFKNGIFSDIDTPTNLLDKSQKYFQDSIKNTVQLIIDSGSIPVLIKGAPVFDRNIAQCTLNKIRFDIFENCDVSRSVYEEKHREWNFFVNEISKKFRELIVVDPAKVMCDEILCYSELNDIPLYKDGGHLNYLGSELIGELYLKKVGNPFVIKNADSSAL